MPLIGHAVVGWATALQARPPRQGPATEPASSAALWTPAVIALAYLPDLVAQAGLLAGWTEGPRAGHSLLFAAFVAPLAALGLSRLPGVSFRRGLAVAAVSLALHDLLDVLQASDRQPWWPFSSRPLVLDRAFIPEDPLWEAVVFGTAFTFYWVLRRLLARRRPAVPPGPAWLAWTGRLLTGGLLLLAVSTHGLRALRERQLEGARLRIERRDYQDGLRMLEEASRWPSPAKPGRVDYLRGEAFAGMGDRAQAEEHYLRSFRADPGYFWLLADLAAFYAGGPEPPAARRQRVAPLLERLRRDHPRHDALPRMLQRVERSLARSRPAS